ncbi:MAG: DUF1801 domain-containing protein [Dehalococcoidia bacterium]
MRRLAWMRTSQLSRTTCARHSNGSAPRFRSVAPQATDVISYQVPTFRHYGSLVGFAAARNHCTFHVMSTAVIEAHAAELEGYALGKGSIRFAPRRPLPAAPVRKLVRARSAENERLRRK